MSQGQSHRHGGLRDGDPGGDRGGLLAGGLMEFNGTLMGFHRNLMGFHRNLMGFNGIS